MENDDDEAFREESEDFDLLGMLGAMMENDDDEAIREEYEDFDGTSLRDIFNPLVTQDPTHPAFVPIGHPEFRLNGHSHSRNIHDGNQNEIFDCIMAFDSALNNDLLTRALVWMDYIIPRPVLNECTKNLIKEETKLYATRGYVQREAEQDMAHVLAAEIQHVRPFYAANHVRASHDAGLVFESESASAMADLLARRYAWALAKKLEREMHILERALMCGKIDPEQLYRESGAMTQLDFAAQISNHLLTYQLVLFTLNRVNRKCKQYMRDSPAGFPPELNAIVCGYQGGEALPPWHGKRSKKFVANA